MLLDKARHVVARYTVHMPRRLVGAVVNRWLSVQPYPVRDAYQALRREIDIAKLAAQSVQAFDALRGKSGLRVNLACGQDIRAGWVNIDLLASGPEDGTGAENEGLTFICHDLRLGLDLPEGSCDIIYCSHFFEHLDYSAGTRLIRDCHCALREGGVLRIALPQIRLMFDAYLRHDQGPFEQSGSASRLPEDELAARTLVDHLNLGIYENGEHKYLYDEEKLVLVLREVGFSAVEVSEYKSDIDVPRRKQHSFYVEAVR